MLYPFILVDSRLCLFYVFDDICLTVYEVTHPITSFIVEYMAEQPSFIGYNIVETFDRYGWHGALDFNPSRFMLL